MITIDVNDYFISLPSDPDVLDFIAPMKKLRGGLILDPMLAEPWSCDTARCREFLGRNLCCKVDTRCRYFTGELCRVHDRKPFSCALFPLDLWRVGRARVLVSAKNPIPYARNWSRYDRDMLRCFLGTEKGAKSMLEVQEPVLRKVFGEAEMAELLGAVREISESGQ